MLLGDGFENSCQSSGKNRFVINNIVCVYHLEKIIYICV